MSAAATIHESLVRTVADRYMHEGYEVTVEPRNGSAASLPDDYHPDLIAVKGAKKLLIEVKGKSERLSFDQLRSLADKIRKTSDWKLVLVTEDDVVPPGTENALPEPPEALERSLVVAERLSEQGNEEAAFVTLWIALERLLREMARRAAVPVERLSFNILIRQLYSQGELGIDDFNDLLRLQRVRNQVVHGFAVDDFGVHREELVEVLRRLHLQVEDDDQAGGQSWHDHRGND